MIKPNFATMTTAELKQYVLKHSSDDAAFCSLAARVHLFYGQARVFLGSTADNYTFCIFDRLSSIAIVKAL